MRTDQLIAELSMNPHRQGNPQLRIIMAIALGWLVALAGLLVFLGPPLQELEHTGMASFAVKLGYTVALTSLSVMAAIAAGRPGSKLAGPVALIIFPIILLSLVAMLELGTADAVARREMLVGTAYMNCVKSVVLASMPVFVGLVMAYRILAPTRLSVAGFLIGLSAGSAGAAAFALYCHESSSAFLIAAYTPAILIPAVIGAISGPILLKW
jgi:hypothetical protein